MPTPNRKDFNELLTFAHELADRSGRVILPQFRKRIAVEAKPGKAFFDPVTAADRAAERAIRTMIAARWPEHGIFGEEFDDKPGTSSYSWVIDPIDGTRSFVIGMPVWGTLIALMAGDTPLLGVMDQPYTGERFWSAANASYFSGPDTRRDTGPNSGPADTGPDRRARKIHTRPCADIASAMLATTHPDLFSPGRQMTAFKRLKAAVRDTRYGGDCYAYCLLAAGHIDVVMEAGLKPHDIAALIPIIERAGGHITTWTGEPAHNGGTVLACGDPQLHAQVLELIA